MAVVSGQLKYDEETKYKMQVRNILQTIEARLKENASCMGEAYEKGWEVGFGYCRYVLNKTLKVDNYLEYLESIYQRIDDLFHENLFGQKTGNEWINEYNHGKEVAFLKIALILRRLLKSGGEDINVYE